MGRFGRLCLAIGALGVMLVFRFPALALTAQPFGEDGRSRRPLPVDYAVNLSSESLDLRGIP